MNVIFMIPPLTLQKERVFLDGGSFYYLWYFYDGFHDAMKEG